MKRGMPGIPLFPFFSDGLSLVFLKQFGNQKRPKIMADQSAKPRQTDAVVGQKRLEAQLAVARTDSCILLALPIRGYRQYQPIRPSCADFDTQHHHQYGKPKMAKHRGSNIVMAKCDCRSFNADFQIIFFVRHGINRVVSQRP